jgi:hypothetical protein
LPLYLDKWPKLTREKDIDFFIEAYREEVTLKRSMTLDSSNESFSVTYKRNADRFHTTEKPDSRGF